MKLHKPTLDEEPPWMAAGLTADPRKRSSSAGSKAEKTKEKDSKEKSGRKAKSRCLAAISMVPTPLAQVESLVVISWKLLPPWLKGLQGSLAAYGGYLWLIMVDHGDHEDGGWLFAISHRCCLLFAVLARYKPHSASMKHNSLQRNHY
eukprot:Skav212584  [mRNA]  locus=scaffold125:463755:464198:- [translate_table: standard]